MSRKAQRLAKAKPSAAKEAPKVRLAASALFFTATCPVPPGIRARDLGAMVQGLVEEHSPLPLEQTAWGFLLDNQGARKSHLFYYAGARDFIFKNPAESADLSFTAVLPGLAALHGLHFSRDTWLFLHESECLTAVLFTHGSMIPQKCTARFFKQPAPGTDALFAMRDAILKQIEVEDGQDVLPGLVRIAAPLPRRQGGLSFPLEHLKAASGNWEPWKTTHFPKASRLQAADIRDRDTLSAHWQRRDSGRRFGQIALLLLLAILLLGGLELLQNRRQAEAARLQALSQEQAPGVQRLQDIERMAQSLKRVFEGDFQPYRWLMAFNYGRPEAVSFTGFAIDEKGAMTVNGRAPEVKTLNDYFGNLKKNPQFSQVDIASTTTDRDGASFTLKAQAGDLTAAPPPLETPEESNTEGSRAEASGPESTPEEEPAP